MFCRRKCFRRMSFRRKYPNPEKVREFFLTYCVCWRPIACVDVHDLTQPPSPSPPSLPSSFPPALPSPPLLPFPPLSPPALPSPQMCSLSEQTHLGIMEGKWKASWNNYDCCMGFELQGDADSKKERNERKEEIVCQTEDWEKL